MTTSHVLVAKYTTYTIFKLPDGINSIEELNTNPDIKYWEVKYNRLCIEYHNRNTIEIESEFSPDESTDYKFPETMDVEPIENYKYQIVNDSDDSDNT